jgi:hypothetical protein
VLLCNDCNSIEPGVGGNGWGVEFSQGKKMKKKKKKMGGGWGGDGWGVEFSQGEKKEKKNCIFQLN